MQMIWLHNLHVLINHNEDVCLESSCHVLHVIRLSVLNHIPFAGYGSFVFAYTFNEICNDECNRAVFGIIVGN